MCELNAAFDSPRWRIKIEKTNTQQRCKVKPVWFFCLFVESWIHKMIKLLFILKCRFIAKLHSWPKLHSCASNVAIMRILMSFCCVRLKPSRAAISKHGHDENVNNAVHAFGTGWPVYETKYTVSGLVAFKLSTVCLTTIKESIYTLVNITGRGQLNHRPPQTTEAWGKVSFTWIWWMAASSTTQFTLKVNYFLWYRRHKIKPWSSKMFKVLASILAF